MILHLEAFTVNNGWAGFVILLFADPHLLEGLEGSKDGSSNPYRVLSFWWCNDLNLHCWWSKSSKFLLHSVVDSWVHCGSTRQDSVGIQVLTDVNIHFMMELYEVSWIPTASIPRKAGWKRASGARNLSFPMVMTCPSGSS